MGVQQEQEHLFSYKVNLEARVRRGNPLRLIKEQIDFDWIRDEVRELYGTNGHVSTDPVVVLKLLLLLFLDNIRSERELMKIVPERLDYLWFLGLSLDDSVPDHSVLSKARSRWGKEVFEKFFVKTVHQCVQLGLVNGSKIHIDSSIVDANASSTENIVQASTEWIEVLKELYDVEDKKINAPERKRSYRPKYKTMISRTDPDAPLVAHDRGHGRGKALPRYKHHRIVDDANGVITAVESTGAHVHDGACLLPLISLHDKNCGTKAVTVVGDKHYGTRHNIKSLIAQGRRVHTGVFRSKGQAHMHGVFHSSEFVYQKQTDTFLCPGGKQLTRRGYNKNENGWYYRAGKKICGSCPLKSNCVNSPNPNYTRMILRLEGQSLIDEGYRQSASREARKDRIRRMYLIEGSFGVATMLYGLKKSRWRRLWRQSIQDYLISAIQNIKAIVRKGNCPNKEHAMCAVTSNSCLFH